MGEHRAYGIGTDGHIVRSTALIRDNDSVAIAKSEDILADSLIELWGGERLVARIERER